MFLEFLTHLLSFDVGWIISLIFSNLHYLFLFAALMFFFQEGKKVLLGFVVIVFLAWLWNDMVIFTGIALFTGGFLAIYYITKLGVMKVAEETPSVQKKLYLISELQFLAAIAIFILFIMPK